MVLTKSHSARRLPHTFSACKVVANIVRMLNCGNIIGENKLSSEKSLFQAFISERSRNNYLYVLQEGLIVLIYDTHYILVHKYVIIIASRSVYIMSNNGSGTER